MASLKKPRESGGGRAPSSVSRRTKVVGVLGMLAVLAFLVFLQSPGHYPVKLVGPLACLAALVQLIYRLSQSFASIRFERQIEQRGFEPLFPRTASGTASADPPNPQPMRDSARGK